MAVMPADEAGKRKALCFNEKLFDLARVERMAMELWPLWLAHTRSREEHRPRHPPLPRHLFSHLFPRRTPRSTTPRTSTPG
eukprot:3448785-Alexandrium_andersonii.AAC.1